MTDMAKDVHPFWVVLENRPDRKGLVRAYADKAQAEASAKNLSARAEKMGIKIRYVVIPNPGEAAPGG